MTASPATGLRVLEFEGPTDARWAKFVEGHPDAHVYHHPIWLQALTREYGRKPVCLACEDAQGNLRGVLSLLPTRGLPLGSGAVTGRRLSSLPRTPVAGPLSSDATATALLVTEAIRRVGAQPGTRLELKAASAELDGIDSRLVGVPWRHSYVLRLPSSPEQLRFGNARQNARVKAAINKAARLGVLVSEAGDESDLRGWYRLYLETMRWHFLPARPYRFFDALWELLRPRGMMRLLLARHEGRLIAGSVFLMYGKTIFYAFNGRRHRDLNLNPNYAIQWRSLVDASRDGFARYDFGEVAEGRQGLADFKSKWGAESQMLHRYYYPSVPAGRSGEGDAGPTRLAHMARLAWRRLPLRLTGKVGGLIYDFL